MTEKLKWVTQRQLMNAGQLQAAIEHLADDVFQRYKDIQASLALVGIRKRGEIIAERMGKILLKKYKTRPPNGVLDITLYRDDVSEIAPNPVVGVTEIPFDVTGKTLILVDDVLYTGRTVRAALDAITDLGRPSAIRLAILVDRGLRELPIQPDFCSIKIETTPRQTVDVLVKEIDGEDGVYLKTLTEG